MFDINTFKRSIQAWTEKHPDAKKEHFLSYCEELIPMKQYSKYSWLIDQATMWFENQSRNRKSQRRSS